MNPELRKRCTPSCKIVLGYIIAASLWIFCGDAVLFYLWPEKTKLFELGLLKGLGFVVFTSLALFFLLRKNAQLMFKAHLAETANHVLPASITKIFSATPVIVYSLEYHNGLSVPTWVNSNVKKILGYNEEDALSLNWWQTNLHPEDRDKALRESARILLGSGGSHEYRFRRADGTYLYAKDELQLIETTAEGAKLFIGVWTDLTEQHESNLALKAYADRVERTMYKTVNMIAELTELRDPYTAGHEVRVGELAAAIATEMGHDQDFQQGLRIAGMLHDVGKIGIPSEILIRPRKLNSAQFDLLKTHAEYSYLLIKNIDFPWPIAEIAYQHHERLDGSGYPRGLKGKQIIPEARILAVADVVESMKSHRPYRAALGLELALEEIERNAGKLYDQDVSNACLCLFREKHYEIPDAGKPDSTFNKIEETRSVKIP